MANLTLMQRDAIGRVINGHDLEEAAGGALYTNSLDIDILRDLLKETDLTNIEHKNIFKADL